MANYTKVFDNPYPSGWENLPSENTPITAEALQEHTDAISHIEDYLNDNPIKDATDVSWNQIQTSGDKIAEITIDGQKQNVFAPQQRGGASTWSEVAEKPFSTIGGGLRVQNDVLQSTDLSGTKAEFDAIKDSLPDGSAFDTTDENVGGGQAQEIYDGEERVIGTWFSKPLYRKAIQYTNINALVTWINTNIVGIDKAINIKGFGYGSDSCIPLPFSGSDGYIELGYFNSNTSILIRCSNQTILNNYKNGYLILEYTKTTD